MPSYSIGKSARKFEEKPIYNYMHSKNDDIQLSMADLKRRNSTPCIRIGTDQRVIKDLYLVSSIKIR